MKGKGKAPSVQIIIKTGGESLDWDMLDVVSQKEIGDKILCRACPQTMHPYAVEYEEQKKRQKLSNEKD